MTTEQAKQWIKNHDDDGEMVPDELKEVFVAIYQREPAQDDYDLGLWSLVCV